MIEGRVEPSDRLLIAEGLGKTYYKGGKKWKGGVLAMLRSLSERLRGQGKGGNVELGFEALRELSFTLRSGDVLGIIGRNGAGKSTLLQILSRIVSPSKGTVRYNGRVAAVLDVGTGFHPELTGRENVYFSGSLMGMSKTFIHSKFDEILAFSGVEAFIDTPVKHYSSGMYVRLAFAVAAFMEADILLFDEVLAVGDMEFRLKVYERVKAIAQSGAIVVMAGHDLGQIAQLCNRCLWLHEGGVYADGVPSDVIEQYMESYLWEAMGYGMRPPAELGELVAPTERHWLPKEAPGNDYFRLSNAAVRVISEAGGNPKLSMNTAFEFELGYEKLVSGFLTSFYVSVYHISGIPVLSTVNSLETIDGEIGKYVVRCVFPPNLFNHGLYYIDVWVGDEGRHFTLEFKQVIFFKIACPPELEQTPWRDVHAHIRPTLEWQWERAEGNRKD